MIQAGKGHPPPRPGRLGPGPRPRRRASVSASTARPHQDIDELAAAIRARGGELAQEPTDQPWGARDFAVVDPDGFKISISSRMGS